MSKERTKIEHELRKLLPDASDETIREIIDLFEGGEPDSQTLETPPGTPPPSGPPGGGNG